MTLFPSRGILQQIANNCHVRTAFVVTCRDSLGVECREHAWERRGRLVFCARVLYGAWAAWAIKALTPTWDRKRNK